MSFIIREGGQSGQSSQGGPAPAAVLVHIGEAAVDGEIAAPASPELKMLAVVRGSGRYLAENEAGTLSPGDCLLAAPGAEVALIGALGNGLRGFELRFALASSGDGDPWPESRNVVKCSGGSTWGELGRALSDWRSSDPFDRMQAGIDCQQTLLNALRAAGRLAEDDGARLRSAVAALERSFGEPVDLDALAGQSGLSRWQFGARFKALTGRSPSAYLTDLRISHAKRLMLETRLRVRDIAQRCGYRDEYYFSRAFKRATGIAPSDYRLRMADSPRVYAIQYTGELLTLGIKPVASSPEVLPLFGDAAQGVDAMESPPDPQRLTSLKPDLIVFPSYLTSSQSAGLGSVAPAFEFAWDEDVYSRLRRMGDLLGRREAAERWISSYEAKAKETRGRLGDAARAGRTATAFVFHHGGLFVYLDRHFGHTLYRGLGYEAPESVRALILGTKAANWVRIVIEDMPRYAGDLVCLALPDAGGLSEEASGRYILRTSHWNGLRAVAEGRAYVMNDSWGNYNPITLESHLGEMERLLGQGGM
ncbi:AraC family transcriptional regulator [Cohnella hashimotonis]|uniref:AraC family transcriptional regulator n=1 Tax=Cohnella hashimotonis TaxID=2826895 RepID=A0ABT6TI94_9BACL|nr:AraC family transcriptional regulator [Cohnella hashimotonis]MDI4646424.1 AraC family transcriptional regulator [Cohnella hashimotonis]